jgi:hypothetical protein
VASPENRYPWRRKRVALDLKAPTMAPVVRHSGQRESVPVAPRVPTSLFHTRGDSGLLLRHSTTIEERLGTLLFVMPVSISNRCFGQQILGALG